MLIWRKGSRRSVPGAREGCSRAGVFNREWFFPHQGTLTLSGDILVVTTVEGVQRSGMLPNVLQYTR